MKKVDLVCFGEILVDFYPTEAGISISEAGSFRMMPGGAAANVAVGAVKMGLNSAFLGKVGNDPFGRYLQNALQTLGVDPRGLTLDSNARTAAMFFGKNRQGAVEHLVYRDPGADLLIRPGELDASLLESTSALYCASLTLTREPARSAHQQAVELAQKGGALVAFDVNHRPGLWKTPEAAREQILKMAAKADLIKVNAVELELLTGSQDPAVAKELLGLRGDKPELVAVTLGSRGSYFCTYQNQGYAEPFEIQDVDPVGCGDAFMAGLLKGYLQRENWQSRLAPGNLLRIFRYANAAGALTAQAQGVIPALPVEAEIEMLVKKKATAS